MNQVNPQLLMEKSELIYSASEVESSIVLLADAITNHYSDKKPLLLCLMNGGLVLCGKLLPLLNFPLNLDYIHATRYRERTQGSRLSWQHQPNSSIVGRSVIIVDDILDEGETLVAVTEWCQQQGAAEVSSVVLCTKQHNRKFDPDFSANFSALTVPDRYVFGYGMDCYGWWRNAQGIYALVNPDLGE